MMKCLVHFVCPLNIFFDLTFLAVYWTILLVIYFLISDSSVQFLIAVFCYMLSELFTSTINTYIHDATINAL